MEYHWYIDKLGYAFATIYPSNKKDKKICIRMHRFLLNAPQNLFVDHADRDPSNNRRSNIRLCTPLENARNVSKCKGETSSKYKGVVKLGEKWGARIRLIQNKNQTSLGTFLTEIAAANAYNYYAKIEFEEFASLNDCPYMDFEEWNKYKVQRNENPIKRTTYTYNKKLKNWRTSYEYMSPEGKRKRKDRKTFSTKEGAAEYCKKINIENGYKK